MPPPPTGPSIDAPPVDGPQPQTGRSPARWTRRRVLTFGAATAAAVTVAGAAGIELISHQVLPGKRLLDQLDGACSVAAAPISSSTPGPQVSGSFYSQARKRNVGYTIAYPPGHHPGDSLPLIVTLHGYGGNHINALDGTTPARALAFRPDDRPLPPMAMVTVDGGGGYWNPHPGDNPMAMVTDELIPMCQLLRLGQPPQPIATMGISMGGYGAILLAERFPHLINAVAAISPAIWTSYTQARNANPGAYATAVDFAADDAITLTAALKDTAIRVAIGNDDPFHPGVVALARVLPPQAVLVYSHGCHTSPFFRSQQPPSLHFLGQQIT
jgi:pimeloyl-ACP methyl ester carboxylesterase